MPWNICPVNSVLPLATSSNPFSMAVRYGERERTDEGLEHSYSFDDQAQANRFNTNRH